MEAWDSFALHMYENCTVESVSSGILVTDHDSNTKCLSDYINVIYINSRFKLRLEIGLGQKARLHKEAG